MKESDIYFLALHEDMEDDIVITKTGATTVDLGSKSEEELSSFKDLLVEEMVNIGCEITSAEIYRDVEVISSRQHSVLMKGARRAIGRCTAHIATEFRLI